MAMTSARLSSTNKLLCDVAAIQRHAEDLCPRQHSISDVMSEFSIVEPEASHATPAPNVAQVGEAESCHAVHAEPAATEVKGVGSSSMPDWACFGSMSTTAAQSGLNPGSGSPIPVAHIPDFGSLLAHTSSQTSAVGVAAALEAGAAAAAAGQRDAEGSVSAAGDGDFPVPAVKFPGSAVGPQESPLPAMMSELQEAMSASVSSTGEPGPHCTLFVPYLIEAVRGQVSSDRCCHLYSAIMCITTLSCLTYSLMHCVIQSSCLLHELDNCYLYCVEHHTGKQVYLLLCTVYLWHMHLL